MPRSRLGQAAVLGLLHGPAELLPISSSGHVTAVPWLLGWDYQRADPELRKSFEVALHAGTAAALVVTLRAEVSDALRTATPRLLMLVTLAFLPPAGAGYLLEGPIERRLGRPASVAAGLAMGSVGMLWADRTPVRRDRSEATAADALWLGVAQACALVPGVSRNGATLAAARRRGFSLHDAGVLSRHVALPIIAAASARQLVRLRRRSGDGAGRQLLVGALSAFVSTLASSSVIARVEPERSLLPFALYRLGLAFVILRRLGLRSAPSRTMAA